jgi:hypothetical protein
MKTINSFIIEHSSNSNTRVLLRKGLSRVSNKQSTPDKIVYNKQKIYKYDDEHAYPFILNLVCNKIIWGENSSTHNDILFNMEDSEKKPYGLDDVLFVDELSFPEYVKDNNIIPELRLYVIENGRKGLMGTIDDYTGEINTSRHNNFSRILDDLIHDKAYFVKDELK